MSELHVQLAKLAAEMPQDARSNLGFLSKVPKDVLQRYVPVKRSMLVNEHMVDLHTQDIDTLGLPTKDQRKPQDVGSAYKRMLDVMLAIESDDPMLTLEACSVLNNPQPVKILLAEKVDLHQLAENAESAEYNKKFFAGLVLQVNNPKATGIVYPTGRMIITGTRKESHCRVATDKCMEIVRKAGCKINPGDSYKIQNICATTHLGYKVRIHEMASNTDVEGWGKIINFSPEMFSGLVCNFESPKVTVVCFATGTVLYSGAQHEEDIQIAADRFRVLSYPFRY